METMKKNKHFAYRYGKTIELRAAEAEEGPIIEGHAIVYEEPANIGGWFIETIKRGALDEADLTDVPFFIHHNDDRIPVARSRKNNGNSTMSLTPDNKGLFFSANIDTENNVEARALHSAVRRGDITGMSYAFRVKEEKWTDLDKDMPKREIIKFEKIGEISALWSPAYDGTSIEARAKELDSSDKQALDSARASLLDSNMSAKKEIELLKLKIKIKGAE